LRFLSVALVVVPISVLGDSPLLDSRLLCRYNVRLMDAADAGSLHQDVENRKRTAQEFEQLGAHKRARGLTNGIYAVTRQPAFAADVGLVDQIRRAAVSVVCRIAEASEQGTTQEFAQSLYRAKCSCGEIRAQLAVALDQKYLSAEDCELMTDQCLLVSRMLGSFLERLQDPATPEPKQHAPQHEAASADEEWQRVINELAEQRKRREC
jgi:four helix bundle protein